MKRISRIVAVCRAVEGAAVVSQSRNVSRQPLFQAALYTTGASTSPRSDHRFSCNKLSANTVAGTMSFSVAASSLAQEVHAKEPVQQKVRPEDVVLYQYEACPFCNKIKGIHLLPIISLRSLILVFFSRYTISNSLGFLYFGMQ